MAPVPSAGDEEDLSAGPGNEVGANASRPIYGRNDRRPRERGPERGGEPSVERRPEPVRAEPDEEDTKLRDLATFLARALVDYPDDVRVMLLSAGATTALELNVHQEDLAHVIGRQGRTARSMRLVLAAAAARTGRKATLEIAD